MAYRELEVTLLSARDLKNVNLFMPMDVYAVASISGDPMTRQCTPTDTSGGSNPSWNATLRFPVPPSAKAAGSGWFHVLLRSERTLGDRDVGEVIVPLAELLTGADGTGPQPPRLASYQVHTVHRGEPRGVLSVSYRLGPVVAPVAEIADENSPRMGYPAPQQPYYKPPKQAPPQPYLPPPDSYVLPPQRYLPPHDSYAPPPPPRHEEAPSPANGKSNGRPTPYYLGPQTQIFLSAGFPSPLSNPAKEDGRKPKPFHAPTQPNASPARTDHSWPKASQQLHGTPQAGDYGPNWPNASPKKPDGSRPKPSYTSTQPITSPVRTDQSWPKAIPQQHHDTPTWPNASPVKPDRSTRPQQPVTKVGEQLAHTQSKIEPGKADHSRPQAALQEQKNTQVSNIGARKTNDTQVGGEYARTHSNIQPGKADSTRPKEPYANSRSNSTPGKADHQSGPRAVLQIERVPSLPTATAR